MQSKAPYSSYILANAPLIKNGVLASLLGAFLGVVGHGSAATIFKSSSAAISQTNTADWSSTSGLYTPTVTATTDIIEFGSLTGSTNSFTLAESVTFAGLQFSDTLSAPITIQPSAHQLNLGAAGITVSPNSVWVKISQNLNLTSTQTWTADLMSNGIEFAGSISGDPSSELTLKGNFTSDHNTTLNPALGTATSATPRAFVFSGNTANTYTGKTIVDFGILVLKKTNGVTAVAGDIDVKNAAAVYLLADDQIASTSVLTLSGGAKYIINGKHQVIGGLNSTGSTSLVEASNGGGIASTLRIQTAVGTSYYFNSGIFRNGGTQPLSVVKTGLGTQIVTGAMQFTGGLTVNEGTFVIRATGANNYNGNVRTIDDWKSDITIGPSGTLELEHTNGTVVVEALKTKLMGQGNVVKSGAGTIRLSADNSGHIGQYTVEGGTLQVSGGLAIHNASSMIFHNVANAKLELIDDETVGSISGGGTLGGHIALGNKTLTIGGNSASTTYSGAISGQGNLTKIGTGEQILNGTNTFTGSLFIQSGTVTVQGGNAVANTATVNIAANPSATFKLGANETIGRIEGGSASGGTIDLGSNTLTLTEGEFGGKITGIDRTAIDPSFPNKFSSLIKTGSGTLYLTGTNNDYKGFTELSGGILNVAKIGNVGEASSLGQRMAEASSSDVGLIFRGGTLQYTGSTAQSTNRAVRIDINGGAYIDASGSNHNATVSFTRTSSPDFYVSSGNRQLTLTGTNQGNNTWNMAITQTGGSTTLNKTGSGHWIITGTSHNYTGDTNVQAGALLINGTVGNTAVKVSNGAKLGGTGTIGGVTTIEGQLSPGGDSSLTASNFSTGFGVGTLKFGTASQLSFTGANASLFVQLGTSSQSDRIQLDATSGTSLDLGISTQLVGSFLGTSADLKTSAVDESYSKYWIGVLADGASRSGVFANSILKDSTFWSEQLGGALSSEWNHAYHMMLDGFDFAVFYNANFNNQSLTGGNDILLVGVIPEPQKALLLALGVCGLVLRRRR